MRFSKIVHSHRKHKQTNLSTPRLEGRELLEVRPEPRLSPPPSKAGLRTAERANITLLILLSGMLALGLVFPSFSSPEIYKYVDGDGVLHLTNVPNGRYNLVLKEGWVPFHLDSANLEKYDPLIWRAAEKYNVNYALVKAVIKAESNFNPRAISNAGARGLMQLMPETANVLRVNDPFHPEDNIEGGVRHLRYLLDLFKGDLHFALAAYNAGEEAVFRYNDIPPYRETRTYVQRVLKYFRNYSKETRTPYFSGSTN
jgi:soluble lytic murein transglycosylase-like protein